MVRIEPDQTLKGHEAQVWGLAFAPGGELLASTSSDATLRLWHRADDGKWGTVQTLNDKTHRTIRNAAFSPDGRKLALASFDGSAQIYERHGTEFVLLSTLEGHESEVKSVAWNASGELLATCSRDKTVWIWETGGDGDMECAAVLSNHTQDVKCVLFHPTIDLLASGSYDDTIKMWHEDHALSDWVCVDTLVGHSSTVWSIAFSGDGSRLVSASDDKTLIVWVSHRVPGEASETALRWTNTCVISGYHSRTILSVDWSHVSGLIVTGALDNAIRVFKESDTSTRELPSFDLVQTIEEAHEGDVNDVIFHPSDPQVLVSAGEDNLVRIWKVTDL